MITSVVPDCYPLSRSMVQLLAEERQVQQRLTVPFDLDMASGNSLEEQLNELKEQLLREWDPLIQEIAELRARAEEPLRPALEGSEKLSTRDFREILSETSPLRGEKTRISSMTVSRWRGRGFLRAVDENDEHIAVETALAVLMMRLADDRHQKGWLPAGSYSNEPYMYVWRKDGPGKPALPCGLPLSQDVPTHAFLFTPFRFLGLLYPDHWFSFAHLGSVRFAGTIKQGKKVLWNLTEEEIRIWDPSLQPLGRGILDSLALQARDNLANLVLLRLATEEFQRQTIPS